MLTERSRRLFFIIAIAVIAIGNIVFSIHYAIGFKNNFDMIGYSAVANKWRGYSIADNHKLTYDSLRQFVSDDMFLGLTGEEKYRKDVFNDHRIFEQQFPFYEIKPLYLSLVVITSIITRNDYRSMQIISCVGYISVLIAIFLFLVNIMNSNVKSFLITFLASWLPYVIDLFRLSTPDSIAAAMALFAVYSVVARHRPVMTVTLVALTIGIRPDYAALGVILGFSSVLIDRKNWRFSAILASTSVLLYFIISKSFNSANYVLFLNFSMIEPRISDLARVPVYYDFRIFVGSILQSAIDDQAFMLMAAISISLLLMSGKRMFKDLPHIMIIATMFAAMKFAVLPIDLSRLLVFPYILFFISMIQIANINMMRRG